MSDPPTRAERPDRSIEPVEQGATLFVWACWSALLAIALGYVVQFGLSVPLWDDYAVVPQLTNREPATLSWFWSQHSEHRIPLARLILLETFRATGGNPRPIMYLIVLLLGAAAAGLILAVRRARGAQAYADAFLPILLLNLGHHENFLWAIQVTYVIPVVLLLLVLALIVRQRGVPGMLALSTAAVCLAAMPLCNAGGLAFIPAMSVWLWSLGLMALRGPMGVGRRRGFLIVGLSFPAILFLVLYFLGYVAPKQHAAPSNLGAVIRTTGQFLSMGLGRPAVTLWPTSGLVVMGSLLGSASLLVWAWFRYLDERPRILGLICILGSACSLALGTGWGRSGQGDLAGLQPRYATLAAPTLAVCYLVFAIHGPGILKSLVPMVMFSGASILLWPNAELALAAGRTSGQKAAAFERDLASGVPPFRLARRYSPFLHPSQGSLHKSFGQLRDARIGRFGAMRVDPEFVKQILRPIPGDIRLAHWKDDTIEATGPDPWVRFDLPQARIVAGIRIRYSHANADGAPARFRLAWRRPGQYDFPADQQYGNWNLPTGDDRVVTVWIDDLVSQVRIQPDNRPCRFKIEEFTLLTESGIISPARFGGLTAP